MDLIFDAHIDTCRTSFKGYLETPYSYNEAVARLYALVDYNIFEQTDKYKISFCVSGTYKEKVFTIYDYKCDEMLHIGCHGAGLSFGLKKKENKDNLDVESFNVELLRQMAMVEPKNYTAKYYYDNYDGNTYSYPI